MISVRNIWRCAALVVGLVLATTVPVTVASQQDPAPNPNVDRLLTTRACRNCDFTGVTLINKDLRGVDLTGANFRDGSLYGCDLTGADLSGASFLGGSLKRSNLKDAKLAGTNLLNASIEAAINAAVADAVTDETTTCVDLSKGPCR